MANLQYQTLQIPLQPLQQGGPSAAGQNLAAGVKLLHKAARALNEWSVARRIHDEIEALAPRIEAAMPSRGGVLLCVAVQEWETPDATGSRAQMFLSVHIAGAGADPGSVLQAYVLQPRLVQGAAKGWRRKEAFVWATRS